jgi:hypothetical protein
MNGAALDQSLIERTVSEMILLQLRRGFSSDVAWALFFCIQSGIPLTRNKKAIGALEKCKDFSIAIQAANMVQLKLLPSTFRQRWLAETLKRDPDEETWLLAYEMTRQGFAKPSPALAGHAVFGPMLRQNIAFYRQSVPAYATLLHPGGAPPWIVAEWLKRLRSAVSARPSDAPPRLRRREPPRRSSISSRLT